MADYDATDWNQVLDGALESAIVADWGDVPPTPTPATPTVTLVSPAQGQIAANDEVVIDITVPAPANLRLILLSVAFPLAPLRAAEVIYSSSRGASQPYSNVTTEDISDDENNGVRVRMTRLGGWPATELRFDPDVVTTDGGENP